MKKKKKRRYVKKSVYTWHCVVCGVAFQARREDARMCGKTCNQVNSRYERKHGVPHPLHPEAKGDRRFGHAALK